MKLEYEVFKCDKYDETLYSKKNIIESIKQWLNEEVIEEDDEPHPINDIRDIIEIRKILVDEK